jgi:hypothetical protein
MTPKVSTCGCRSICEFTSHRIAPPCTGSTGLTEQSPLKRTKAAIIFQSSFRGLRPVSPVLPVQGEIATYTKKSERDRPDWNEAFERSKNSSRKHLP